MKKGVWELCTLLVGIAFLVSFLYQKEEGPGPASPEKPPVSQQAPPVSRQKLPISLNSVVPSFSLQDQNGNTVEHKAGTGPRLIVLTATGCKDCLTRIDKQDTTAYEMAKKSGYEVWNLLVYHPQDRTSEFLNRYTPAADVIMADPTSRVSVKMLGGSDTHCWMLIDEAGRLVYRGGTGLSALQKALSVN